MADIEKRKRAANKKEQTKVEDKLRDEIRTLHEAYQFLSKKYIKLAETMLQAKEEAMLEQLSKEEKERKARAAAAKKSSNTKMSISDMMFEEDFDEEYEYEDFYNDDPNDRCLNLRFQAFAFMFPFSCISVDQCPKGAKALS